MKKKNTYKLLLKVEKCFVVSYFTLLAKYICDFPINLNFLVKSKMAVIFATIPDDFMDPKQPHYP